MHPIVECMEKDSRLVVGLMSGTSADGVDAALCRITGHGTASKIEQLGFVFQPFSGEIRREILRLASGMDRSHKQKIKDIKVSMKGGHTMQILVDTAEDLTLEQALFREKAEFFEEVYSIRPVLKAKKLL